MDMKWVTVNENVTRTELQQATNLTELRNRGNFLHAVELYLGISSGKNSMENLEYSPSQGVTQMT